MELKFREFIQLNPDPRDRFKLDPQSQTDQKMLEDVQKTVKEISKECFSHCVQTIDGSESLSGNETKCIEDCTRGKLRLFEEVFSYYSNRLNQPGI